MGAKGPPNPASVGLGRRLGNVTSGLRPERADERRGNPHETTMVSTGMGLPWSPVWEPSARPTMGRGKGRERVAPSWPHVE